MILVRVGDQDTFDRVKQIERLRKKSRRTIWRIERATNVKQNTLSTRGLDFNTVAADLIR